MEEAYQRAVDILTEHMDKLHAVAEVLVIDETIEAEQFYQIMDGVTKYQQLAEESKPADGGQDNAAEETAEPAESKPEQIDTDNAAE